MQVRLTRLCLWIAILSCSAFAVSITPTVDLGWLRVIEQGPGWQIVRVFDSPLAHEPLQQGDVIVAVDGKTIVGVNALTAARMLHAIGPGVETISVLRNGQKKLLRQFPSNQPLLKESLRFRQGEGDFAVYRKDDVIPSITLPDVSGRTQTVHYGSQFVLIHIWSTRCPPCWADIEALNEFANPAPESLSLVTVDLDDTSDSLDQFTKLHPVQVVNLMGGGWESKFANDFNIIGLPTDVLVDIDGHVIFVGVGAGSFRSAIELVKGYALL